jgi:hypothetical protein
LLGGVCFFLAVVVLLAPNTGDERADDAD